MAQAKLSEVDRVFNALAAMVEKGEVIFPEQVVDELLRGRPDHAEQWAKRVTNHAVGIAELAPYLAEIIKRVPDLVDPNNTSTTDEADPWIVTLAVLRSRDNLRVSVITEDFRDRVGKTSVASACGVFEIPALRMRAFLRDLGIWPESPP